MNRKDVKCYEKILKVIGKVILGIVILVLLLGVGLFSYHKIQLAREEKYLEPLGELVEVDGHNISVYTEGTGEKTLVFLQGGGMPSPILESKSLYSLLNDDYRIVVIERPGYGFSDEDLRKKNGWSQEELGEQLGVSRQAVSKWESMQTVPDINKIIAMAEFFGVSTDYLLKDEMEEPEKKLRKSQSKITHQSTW